MSLQRQHKPTTTTLTTTMATTLLGQDPSVLWAVWENLRSWLIRTFFPMYLPRLVPPCPQEWMLPSGKAKNNNTQCILISRPGGVEQLRVLTLQDGYMTCGYNLMDGGPFCQIWNNNETEEHGDGDGGIPNDCVVLRIHAFSVNYADCCIRWGLYDSAKQKVGYPICPGFDVAGIVERIGGDRSGMSSTASQSLSSFAVGDQVFGCSLFGSYSTRVLVPALHLRKIPKMASPTMTTTTTTQLTLSRAAAVPAVSLTALYALFLAGHFPTSTPQFSNRSILIHSAAGGVGSMLVQMSKLLGLHPIVGVVGRSDKVDVAMALGCTHVIDKSACRSGDEMWDQIGAAGPATGYATVMESNGIATLAQSYDSLTMTGRLIVYGFHTNLPMGQDMLSPWQWIQMARKKANMPLFDAMAMGRDNKAVLAFNLSFFATEREMLSKLFDQIVEWLAQGKLECPPVTTYDGLHSIAEAHKLIQSGTSVGKIVINTQVE